MAGTLVDTITKHKFSRAMFDEGGTPHIMMTGIITLKDAATDLTDGETEEDSAIITFAATTGFEVGDYVTVDKGLPVAPACYKIIAKSALTLTLDTKADTAETGITVSMIDIQMLDLSEDIPTLQGIIMNPNSGYVFDYTYATKKFVVYQVANVEAGVSTPLEAVTGEALGTLAIHYIAWGY